MEEKGQIKWSSHQFAEDTDHQQQRHSLAEGDQESGESVPIEKLQHKTKATQIES